MLELRSAVLPPTVFRPQDLAEGSLVVVMGRFVPFLHWGLYFVIEVTFIRALIIEHTTDNNSPSSLLPLC